MTSLAFTYRGAHIPVKHQVHRRYKRIHLHVRPDHILIKSPQVHSRHIQDMLVDNADWIQDKFNRQQQLLHQIPETALYLGRSHSLYFQNISVPVFESGGLYLPICQSREDVLIELKKFYGLAGKAYLPERLKYWSERMQLYPVALRLKYLKSRWGSCSSKGNINLNYRAMQLSKSAIDAILIHELAHLRHLNHGPEFWNLVHSFSPDYTYHHQHTKSLGDQLV